jgi:cation diffusion facilitator CzcD-associated flavoprotein CzcO
VWYDHLSYIPFPPHWPIFTPKGIANSCCIGSNLLDKLADWFEAYVKAMELNVWTSTTMQSKPCYDSATKTWNVHVVRSDGTERVLHPRHIVLASGHSGEPNVPKFPGAESFKGDIHHSSGHPGPAKYVGKRAVVVGCCNSAHDIAQGFYQFGAEIVTMVQRSSTYVMSQGNGIRHLLEPWYTENGPATEDSDLFSASVPFPVFKLIQQHVTRNIAKDDHEILTKLAEAGFKLDYGYESSGLFMKYLIRGGGYYIDVGCSKLIGEKKIKIKQGHQISKIVEDGLVFDDGSKLEADVIVLATGYDNMRETARKIFGDELADKVSDVWGFTPEGEIATMWQSTRFLYVC